MSYHVWDLQLAPSPPKVLVKSVGNEMACANYKLCYYIFIVLGFFSYFSPDL